MEKLIIPEQDVINAICFYHARKKYVLPEQVEVELMYEDDRGFSAEAYVNGQQQFFDTADMIAALRLWLKEFLNEDPFAAAIKLVLDDEAGIIAEVQ
ncbi:YxcD family protein [Sporosarcina sp. FSL K6-1522]|uniref:YxcD family protein n=1 Tax=Sporosarcina sp. FSL K6-1522 TaxID=2921554 RepID=UPI0031599DBF